LSASGRAPRRRDGQRHHPAALAPAARLAH
jgi:hypothetical protein